MWTCMSTKPEHIHTQGIDNPVSFELLAAPGPAEGISGNRTTDYSSFDQNIDRSAGRGSAAVDQGGTLNQQAFRGLLSV